jgi:hypothetical protein
LGLVVAFQLSLGVFQPGFQLLQFVRGHAAGNRVDREIGAGRHVIRPWALDLSPPGKAGCGHQRQVFAESHRAAGLDGLPIQLEFGDYLDQIAGYALGQLAQVSDVALRQQRSQGLLVGGGSRFERQGQLLVVDVGKRKVDRIDHGAFDILAEAVTDMLLQAGRQFVVAGTGSDDAVGQRGRQHRECLDDGLGAADHVADRGVLHLGFDIGLQFLLRLGLGILEQLRVEAGRPAFRFVNGAAGDEGLRELLGIDAADRHGIQAGLVLVLFIAGIQAGPAVGGLVFGAARRVKVNRRFDPDMLEAELQ